jgi:hypothetical protein
MVKSRFSALALVLVAIAVLAIFAACKAPGFGVRTGLRIIVDPQAGIKQIVPDISMACANYRVTGSGPTPFSITITEDTTVEDLRAGEYTINIIGENIDGIAIGEGSNTATVTPGSVATCTVTISEYDGLGDFHLDLLWEPLIESPMVSGMLRNAAGAEFPMDFGVNAQSGSAVGFLIGLERGWYSCIIQIYEGMTLRAGFADVVRIVKDKETFGNVSLHVVYGYSDLAINIISSASDPLHFSGNLNATIPGGVFPVFRVTEDDSIPFDGLWYLNGIAIGWGESEIVLAEWELGLMLFNEDYRLDFIGFSLDGKRAGAAHGIVRRIEDVPPLP